MYIKNNRSSYGDKPPGTVIKVTDLEGRKLIKTGWKACDEDGVLLDPEPEPEMITISRSELESRIAALRDELRAELLSDDNKGKLQPPVKTPGVKKG